MTELRFHRDVYAGTSVDEALKVFDGFGTFEREEAPEHWVVRVQAGAPAREALVSRELANYALGLTVRARGSR